MTSPLIFCTWSHHSGSSWCAEQLTDHESLRFHTRYWRSWSEHRSQRAGSQTDSWTIYLLSRQITWLIDQFLLGTFPSRGKMPSWKENPSIVCLYPPGWRSVLSRRSEVTTWYWVVFTSCSVQNKTTIYVKYTVNINAWCSLLYWVTK